MPYNFRKTHFGARDNRQIILPYEYVLHNPPHMDDVQTSKKNTLR